jgi:hypothetical protein
MEHKDFQDVFSEAWGFPMRKTDPGQRLTTKLKVARKHLKEWQKHLPKLVATIDHTKLVV